MLVGNAQGKVRGSHESEKYAGTEENEIMGKMGEDEGGEKTQSQNCEMSIPTIAETYDNRLNRKSLEIRQLSLQ